MEKKQAENGGRIRRIAALAAIVLLAGLYILTFILAVFGDERSGVLLRFCFGMTIFVPLFAWVMIWCIGVLQNRHSMASLDILHSNPAERKRMEEAVKAESEKAEREKSQA